MSSFTVAEKLAALREARNVLDSSAGLSRQTFCIITGLDAIIADYEHLPALVEAAEKIASIGILSGPTMDNLRAALAHFTEAGGA